MHIHTVDQVDTGTMKSISATEEQHSNGMYWILQLIEGQVCPFKQCYQTSENGQIRIKSVILTIG